MTPSAMLDFQPRPVPVCYCMSYKMHLYLRISMFTVSTKSWCYEMRVIEAFSWILFALRAFFHFIRLRCTHHIFTPVVIFLWILITLTTRAQAMGRPYAWREPIIELPWFGQYPGMQEGMYHHGHSYAYPAGYPMQGAYPQGAMNGGYQAGMNGGYVVSQQPGHSVVIQRDANGQPMVTQVPGMVTSA